MKGRCQAGPNPPVAETEPEQGSHSLERILADHSKLAQGIASQYKNKGLPLEDLRQEALLGLIQAYHNFQPDKGAQFSTYAVYWIKKQVLQALNKELASSPNPTILAPDSLDSLEDPTPAQSVDTDLRLPEELPYPNFTTLNSYITALQAHSIFAGTTFSAFLVLLLQDWGSC